MSSTAKAEAKGKEPHLGLHLGAGTQIFWPASTALPGAMAGSSIRSGATKTPKQAMMLLQ